ncbi:T9SS type A sorting domain-containing protein [Aureispira anguillae]|uniref:T9SS type A sorting domain-containing protein n=1 Tax=Aureispira anguillae TaxID=2864201 RepID=A0A915VKA7_9BACT|nr:T9SS type A sorting domain-containing protein [Aureispira anguillae]BDS09607.1 T9SS type A sorting domain-containing protein [Aureispira anguillae]
MFCIKKISLLGCLLLVLIGFSSPLKAISGAELAYECLGANQYKITLQVYRDCSDATLPGNQTIDLNSMLCGANSTTVLTLDSSYEISGIHASQIANSTCNGGTMPGFELFVYSGVVVFPQTCEDWIVSWTGCCRSANITNLSTSGSSIYVEAKIDSRYLYSSPRFHRQKLPYYCANSTHTNRLKVPTRYPSNMDSFVVALTCPLQGANNCLNHTTGLSAGQPLHISPTSAIQIDNIRRELRFHAKDSVGQIAAVALTIYQLKNGDTVGYVQSDFPVVVIDSPAVCNAPVQYTEPITNTAGIITLYEHYNFDLCSSDNLIFSFIAYDPDGDTVEVDLANTNLDEVFGVGNWTVLANSTPPFRPDSVQCYVQVTPTWQNNSYSPLNSNLKRHFRIGVTDGKAPFLSCTAIDLNLSLYQATFLTIPTLCAGVNTQHQLHAVLDGPNGLDSAQAFNWTQISGPPVVFSDATIPNPSIAVPSGVVGDVVVLEVTVTTTPHPITGVQCVAPTRMVLPYDTSGHCINPFPNFVTGQMRIDSNLNCFPDTTEARFAPNTVLLFEKGQDQFYAATNGNYAYQAHLDTGTYTVSVTTPYPYWSACPSSQTFTIDTTVNPQVLDWAMEPLFLCPKLEVNLSASAHMRACIARQVWVNYRNPGTVDAANAYVEVDLTANLTITNSSIPMTNLGNHRYRFDLDSVEVGEYGRFFIMVQASCSSPQNDPYTIGAHIYPDSICTTQLPHLTISDSCTIDTVIFKVTNHSAAHTAPLLYWIIENQTIVDTGAIQLGMGQSLSIYYPGTIDKVYQLVIDPYNTAYAASSHVHCMVVDSNFVDPPFLYRPHNQLSYVSIFHGNTVGSYDPNIKVAEPEGYGTDHYILPNQSIDYTIHFQNTGTDTAYKVVILDTLTAALDVGSLMMQGSSHSYTWRIKPYNATGLNILEITFNNIMLLDSNANEPASHGFIKYSIQQTPNLPNSTLVENSASIYFDNNAPIKTNTAFHTVCDNCYPLTITNNSVITTIVATKNQASATKIYPNPTNGLVVIEQSVAQAAEIELYTISGVLVKRWKTNQQIEYLNVEQLPTGTYLLKVVNHSSSELFKLIRN